MKKRSLFLTPFALAGGLSLASVPAHATFIIDTSCGVSSCAAGTDFFIDDANSGATMFTGTVGAHLSGPPVTVDTAGAVDTGAGFADITPSGSAALTSLTFTPANDALFSDFSFRGQLERLGFAGTVDITWTDSLGTTGMLTVSGVKGPNADFDRIGIVSDDGEKLKSVAISTPGSESFKEVKQVEFSSAIPEPSTWALMLLGFAGLGYAALHRAKIARKEPTIA
jgi:hypothetical protein